MLRVTGSEFWILNKSTKTNGYIFYVYFLSYLFYVSVKFDWKFSWTLPLRPLPLHSMCYKQWSQIRGTTSRVRTIIVQVQMGGYAPQLIEMCQQWCWLRLLDRVSPLSISERHTPVMTRTSGCLERRRYHSSFNLIANQWGARRTTSWVQMERS